ncbi:MAG: type VI secretion system tip protein VgrG [Sandaracinaceae bacterium]|nr:type VI secretion system tip protein VgrG [Sandaracinaceae bacterium]
MAIIAALLHDGIPADAHVAAVHLREAISQVFDCHVRFEALDPDLDLEALLGSTGLLQVWDDRFDADDPEHARFVHGVFEEAEYVTPLAGDRHLYRVRIRPSVHGLAYRFRTRIFQNESPIEVLQRVLRDAGVPDDSIEWNVETYPPREYVTQWKETELAFFMRWLEELGVRFFFEHDDTGHKMVVSDLATQHEPIVGASALVVRERTDAAAHLGDDALYDVAFETRTRHDRWSARDWNFRTPDAPRDAVAGEGGRERYDFPGGYPDDAAGTGLAGVRAEELLHDQNVLTARSTCHRLVAGRTFELAEAAQDFALGAYLVTEAVHELAQARTGSSQGGTWETRLTAIPAGVAYRPPRVAPRPEVWGKESAVVTGPAGEEIHVDDMGQIKVHFYWDREGAIDDTASCWMRVQQLNTASGMALPRVGWEVDVGFLYGDPDRPVVLQKLYNQEHLPPYGLPDNLMQSSLQTSSSPGGGGTNEIRMNDAAGGQEFFVHAQKDLAVTVGNDASETIGVNSTVQVGADYTHKVGGDEAVTIGADQALSVTGGFVVSTTGAVTIDVGGLDDWGVGGVHSVTVAGARTDDISGLMNVLAQKVGHTFNAGHSLSVGGAMAHTAIGAITETTAGSKTELVGGAKLEVISKAKAENVGVGKVLTSGLVKVTTGTDVAIGADGALAINVGGPLSSTCGGDFGISGRSVTFTIAGSLKMTAGGKVQASPGSIKIQGGSVGGHGATITLKGEVHYK